MAVFVAASDETNGGNALSVHHYAGWIAPEPDWSLYFTPAWQERVLDVRPKIPYLHMTDMRSKAWRAKYGLTEDDVEERLDEAARIIDLMGSLRVIDVNIDGSIFKPLYKPHKMITNSGAAKDLTPDHLSFVAYVFAVLSMVHHVYPDAEKVDFMVENNSAITQQIHQLYKSLPQAFINIGHPELAVLVGEFLPVGKDRVPVQAADYLYWHTRRAKAETLGERDSQRFNTIATHRGTSIPLSSEVLVGLAEAFAKHGKENEPNERIRRVRQNHARSDEGLARRNKGRLGR